MCLVLGLVGLPFSEGGLAGFGVKHFLLFLLFQICERLLVFGTVIMLGLAFWGWFGCFLYFC